MGFPTQVKWVWAAMNPMSYSGTNALDEALIGRFATFLYPPDVLKMDEDDRIRVLTHINGDDAPSLKEWTHAAQTGGTVPKEDVQTTGAEIAVLLQLAAPHPKESPCLPRSLHCDQSDLCRSYPWKHVLPMVLCAH